MVDSRINSMNMMIPPKEPMREPEMRSQKKLNGWHIATQLAEAFPSCAKYTMAAAAEAPAVRRLSIALTTSSVLVNNVRIIRVSTRNHTVFYDKNDDMSPKKQVYIYIVACPSEFGPNFLFPLYFY